MSALAPITNANFDTAHRLRRKALRKGLWIFTAAFVLLFSLLLYGLAADEAPPELDDMHVVFRRPPEEQNAYALLAQLASTLPSDSLGDTPQERRFEQIITGKAAWNETVVTAHLGRFPPRFADSVRAALAAPHAEAPETRSYADETPEIGRIRSLGRVLTWHAALAWHTGDHPTAAELNLLALRLGSRISQSQGPLITVLTGTAIQGMAFNSIQKHADSESIPFESLRRYLAELPPYEMRLHDFHIAYKLENVAFAQAAKTITSAEIASLIGSKKTSGTAAFTLPGFWQPNRTIRWHADCIRTVIADDATRPASGSPATALADGYISAPWPLRAQNITGRILLAITLPSLHKTSVTGQRTRANLALTRLYVALRLYHLEHQGQMPGNLAELVPSVLSAPILDPFGGQELRYDRGLTTIWSVDAERRKITDADGALPRGMPAARLRFARPPVILPEFQEASPE